LELNFGTERVMGVGMKYSILVIEDDDSLCFLLGRILKEQFDVTIKNDSLSAMAWLSKANMPNLILCDLDLPVISGLDFVQNIRRSGAYNQIPLIMLSGMTDKKVIEQCLSAGASDYLEKPFNPPQLIEVISKVLKKAEIYV
jgi:two-component system, chemotaxis family, chemotaxis protein CheY